MPTHTIVTKNLALAAIAFPLIAGAPQATFAYPDTAPVLTALATSEEQQTNLSLNWGIRPSFVSYLGGHYALSEGASEHNGTYSFPVQEAQGNEQHLEIKAAGKVQFAEYCEDRNNTDTCKLDLTFSNPKIILDANGESSLTYTVRTRNYSSGKIEGPHEVKMATLDLRGASQTDHGNGTVTWKNIGANLTEDGAHAFSNFYDPGTALDALEITYSGPVLDVDASPFTVKESWNTGFEYDKVHKLYDMGGKLVHLGVNTYDPAVPAATVIDARTLEPLSVTTELPVNGYLAAAADTATGALYIYNQDQQSIEKYRLNGENKLVLVETIASVDTSGLTVMALGYNPHSKALGLLALDGKGSGNFTFIDQEGTVTQQNLPDPLEISPTLKTASVQDAVYRSNYYGETYSFLRPGRVLEPLANGSFVWAPASTAQYSSGTPIMRGYLLQFSPQGIQEITQTIPTDGTGADMRSIKVAGDYLMQWNQNYGERSKVRILKANGQDFDLVYEASQLPHGISSISGMTFDGEHFIVLDADTGKVHWLDESFNLVYEMSIANTKNSNQNVPLLLETATRDLILPTVVEDSETYREITHLVRLERYVRATTPDDEVEPNIPRDIVPTPVPKEPAPTPGTPEEPAPTPAPEEPTPTPDASEEAIPAPADPEEVETTPVPAEPLSTPNQTAPADSASVIALQPSPAAAQTGGVKTTATTPSSRTESATSSSRLAHTGASSIALVAVVGCVVTGLGLAIIYRRQRSE